MKTVSGKVALITGGASGIGLGMAQAFGQAGAKIALVDIDRGTLDAAAASLTAAGVEVVVLNFDVTDREAWANAVVEIDNLLGPVQILCSNAGVSARGPKLETIKPSVWSRFVDINLNAVFHGMQACVPFMRAAGSGYIVNTSSMAGLLPGSSGLGPYAVTKHAVVSLSEVMRQELAVDGIGVSVLCPGPVRTALWRTSRSAMELPDIDAPPPENLTGSAAPDGLDPFRVGLQVLAAMARQEPYIITAPELGKFVLMRFDAIRAALDRAERDGAILRAETLA